MKRSFTKTLALLLSVLMLITAVPLVGFAEDGTDGKISIPCGAKEYNGHYYALNDKSMTWTEAKAYCENQGGHLLTITSNEENEFIVNKLCSGHNNDYWLGLKDAESEGDWSHWITGEEVTFTNWGSSQPDAWTSDQDYAVMIIGHTEWGGSIHSGQWDDMDNGAYADDPGGSMGFICEWDTTKFTGTCESYNTTVVLNNKVTHELPYYISSVKIDGTDYPIEKGVILTTADAYCYINEKVIAYTLNGKIIKIAVDGTKNTNAANWYDDSTETTEYGAKKSSATKASQALEAATNFVNAMQSYITLLGNEGGGTDAVDIKGVVKQLKNNKQAYFSLTEDAPDDAIESAYYGIANYIITIANQNKLYLKINPKLSATEQSLQLVNSVRQSIFSTDMPTYYYGNYRIDISSTGFGEAFTGEITVTKVKGFDKGASYIGPLVSSTERTNEIMSAYINNLSDIVHDQCKYALSSIYTEFMDVTGVSKAEDAALNSFFADKTDILIKKGYGNVLNVFYAIRMGYNTVKKFKSFVSTMGDADKFLSNDNMSNAKWMYDQLNNFDFSTSGVKKSSVKKALSLIADAKKDLGDKLYNYLYSVDSGDPANDTAWDKTKSWFSNTWKCVTFQCPVEFQLFDSNGNVIGYVDSSDKHDGYIYFADDIYIDVDGDVKYVYYPSDMEISIKLIATDNGEMNYSIEQFDKGVPTGKINYFDIPLTNGEGYEQVIPANCNLADSVSSLQLVSGDEKTLGKYSASDDTEANITVDCLASHGGYAIGDGDYPIGACVKMIAYTDAEDSEFIGWYLNGSCVSTDEIYQFTAKENVHLAALFGKIHDHSYSSSTIREPSCIEYGVVLYTCDCGYNYLKILPYTGHSWDGGVVTTAATCTTDGVKTYTCSVCGETKTEVIPATGHVDKNGDGVCDICGAATPCPLCGKIHTSDFWGKLTLFFHRIVYFFRQLFGQK